MSSDFARLASLEDTGSVATELVPSNNTQQFVLQPPRANRAQTLKSQPNAVSTVELVGTEKAQSNRGVNE